MLIVSLAVLAVLVPPIVFDLLARPNVRRLGLRNATRRSGEAALVVAGSMLATALITAALLIGDSFGASVRAQVVTRLGPIDEVVTVDDQDAAATLQTSVGDGTLDGVMPLRVVPASVGSVSRPSLTGDYQLLELDLAEAWRFGGDVEAVGLQTAPTTLAADEAVLNRPTADALGVVPGDQIAVFVADSEVTLNVVAVVPRRGLVGYGDVVTAPGVVSDALADPATSTQDIVAVSNVGDVYTGADRTDDAVALIATALGDDVSVESVKRDLLQEADDDARDMTELFGTVGGFSVVAGVLLLVNLFVMLAGERRRELGTLQAIGVDRRTIRGALVVEGAVYGAIAAAAGALFGVAVSALVLDFADRLTGDSSDVVVGLSVEPVSLATGALLGLAISLLTVIATGARITRLDIVAALSDAPDPPVRQHRIGLVIGALGLIAADVAMLVADNEPFVVVIVPALACVFAIPLLGWFVGSRTATVVLGGIAVVVTASVFGLRSTTLADPDLNLFLAQGVVMVGLSVAVLISAARIWPPLVEAVGARSLSMRLGMAYPLARSVRSGLLVAMYALVIFTITFMAVLNAVFQEQVPRFAREAGGRFDLVVDSSPTNPLTVAGLEARPDVARAVPVMVGDLDYRYVDGEDQAEDWWTASVIDSSFPADFGPQTVDRVETFESDEKVWEALASTGDWIVVPTYSGFKPGDVITALGPDESRDVVVAATTDLNWAVDSGFYVPATLAPWLTDGYDVVTRHYVVAAEGTEPDRLASALEADERRRGADARTFLSLAQADVDEQQAFIRLLQGYLGLGLAIGMAGLGVTLTRSVRERRSVIGMMGALGVSGRAIRGLFTVEAAFIGAQGVGLGVGLGLLTSWLVLTRSTAFAKNLELVIPWTWLGALAATAMAASMVSAVVPAVRASRMEPAAALRVTGR